MSLALAGLRLLLRRMQMPNEPPEDELSKQLSVLTDTIGKLNARLEEMVPEPPSQGAPRQHPPPGSITPGKIWGFVAGNLTILAAITVFLWTSLSDVAEKIAKDTATQTAQTSTARYLQDDPRINALAERARQRLLADIEQSLNIYRNEDRAVSGTLARAQVQQEFLVTRGEELEKNIEAQTERFKAQSEIFKEQSENS
ncbi:MAG: hypothetical protein O7I42_16135 [Alphaproteobacteria bacterium]|nr:hypothetical protein [Alphaproteobacteria bacterium]